MKMHRKPKKPDSSSKQLILEEIIGLTTKNGNGLASNITTGDCIYLAGCVVVVYNVDTGNQSHLMITSRMPKPLTCVAVLPGNGRIAAAAESGHEPAVLVWDYATRALISELKVHRYGVACIAFSPDGKHLVSVGYPHDGYLCIWDWRNGEMVTKLKSSSSCAAISCVTFSSDAGIFVTAGKKHLKFWTVGSSARPRSNVGGSLLAMDGKSVNLDGQKGSSFISVASATWTAPGLFGNARPTELYPIYALTDAGVLCLIKSGFSVKSSVDLKVERSFALSVSNKLIACACSKGVVHLLTIETLKHAGSLQYLEPNENHEATDRAADVKSSNKAVRSTPDPPDAIACQFSTSKKLVVIYGNHSLYIWDVHDEFKVSRCCVLVSHSACVWDIKNFPCDNLHDPALACVARGCCGGVSFATCSTDGTIRLWDLLLQPELKKKTDGPEVAVNQNLGSTSLNAENIGSVHLASAGIFERDIMESRFENQGFRSMAVSSDGKYLAAGDCQGNLHVYNLHTSDYTCIQDAHDSEILTLAFSCPSKNSTTEENHYFLASGGRDRMIHLYDVKSGLELIESIDDHSAAVTSVKLTWNGCKILSCSADRSLVFRDVAITDTGCKVSRSHHQIASHGTLYDMALDPSMEIAVTVGQDKKINTYCISSGKLVKTFKQEGDFGEPIKVTLDPSSSYLVCSYSNKSLCIYDFTNGELVAQATGHGEVITGVVFLPDCRHIISVGGDGCIFVWRLPAILSSRMLQRMNEISGPLSPTCIQKPLLSSECILKEVDYQCKTSSNHVLKAENSNQSGESVFSRKRRSQDESAFKFSISRLPKWARTKVTSKEIIPAHPESILFQEPEPEQVPSLLTNGDEVPNPNGLIEVQTPDKHGSGANGSCLTNISKGSCGTDVSEGSPVQQGVQSFELDKRWHTVHTVYHELMYSPELGDFKVEGLNLEGPRKELSGEVTEGDSVATNHLPMKSFCGPNNQIVDGRQSSLLSERLRSSASGNLCENEVQPNVHSALTSSEAPAELLHQGTSENPTKAVEDDGDGDRKIQLDDLFDQHFSSLSSALKHEGGRLSARRKYSARFVVRRDHLTGSNKLLETLNQTPGDEALTCSDGATPCTSSRHPSSQGPEEWQPSNAPNLGIADLLDPLPIPASILLQSDSTDTSMTDHPNGQEEKMEVEAEDKRHSSREETETQERVNACKDALLNLDSAAESTLQLFSKVEGLISSEKAVGEHRAELYDMAAKFLPSVLEKIHALAQMVESSKKNSCSNTSSEVPGLEPFLGRFAENLSRQVLELVKQNL